MKVCDILGVQMYSDPSYIFSGSRLAQPLRIHAPRYAYGLHRCNGDEQSQYGMVIFDPSDSESLVLNQMKFDAYD